ncbi:MAG: hypothetical protein C4589_02840 [Peptococcaceae bacterium]|nr:MAG: hypothetical protein C4589_02840 [Peptococcaceae bacterium]
MGKRFSGQEGFSLVEALVASIILAVAVVAIIGALASYMRTVQEDRHRALAISAVESLAEKVKNMDFDLVDVNKVEGEWHILSAGDEYNGMEMVADVVYPDPGVNEKKRVYLKIKKGGKVLSSLGFMVYKGGI